MVIRAALELLHGDIFKFLPCLAIRSRRHRETQQGQSSPMARDRALRHSGGADGEVPRRRAAATTDADRRNLV